MSVGLYIGRRALSMTGAVFGGLMVIYICIDMVELFAAFGGSLEALSVLACKLPLIAAQMLPVSVTLGLAWTLAAMRGVGEWGGLCAVGMSPWSLAASLLLVAAGASLVCAGLVSYAAPAGLRAIDAVSGRRAGSDTDVTWRIVDGVVVGGLPQSAETVIADVDAEQGPVWCRYGGDASQCLCWSLETGWTTRCLEDRDPGAIMEARLAMPARAELDPLRAEASRRGPVELWKEAGRLDGLGLGGAAFRAELSLRVATIAACFAVPAFVTIFLVTSRLDRPVLVLPFAAGAALVYYAVLIVTWNLVVTEAASFYWGALGAPALFFLGATVVAVRRGQKAG